MRRTIILWLAMLGGLILMWGGGSSTAWAQEETGFQGTVINRNTDEPVAGVTITVSQNGTEIGTGETAEDGTWSIPVPEPGEYQVSVDESTLPSGLMVRDNRSELTLEARPDGLRTAIFQLVGQGEDSSDPGGEEPGETAPGAETDGEVDEDAAAEDPSQEIEGEGGSTRVVSLTYSGIQFGLIIALAAMGLSLIFGTTGLTNFSHGDLVTFGAVMGFMINVTFDLPIWLAVPGAVALGAAFGWLQDWGFWGWLRRRGTGLITMMIISIGVALMLRFAILYAVGGERRRYREYVAQDPWEWGPLVVAPRTLVIGAISVIVVVTVALLLLYTRLGKATRAVADNPALAEASGINVNQVIRLVWTVGAALAALAGAFLAMNEGVKFDMGQHILLLIFAAVVLGGLGTAFGAIVGALLIGLLVQLSTLWVDAELKYVGALAVLILVLLVRPQGLFGRRERVG